MAGLVSVSEPIYCECCTGADKATMAKLMVENNIEYLEIRTKRHGKEHIVKINLTDKVEKV